MEQLLTPGYPHSRFRAFPDPDSGRRPGRDAAAAFSLIELLTVIAIAAILTVMVAPTVHSILVSSQVTDTGARLAALIEQARMHAAVHNCTTGVRFFENPQAAGEFIAASLVGMVPDANGQSLQTNDIVRLFRFPESVVLSADHSSLLETDSSAGNGTARMPGGVTLSYRDFLIYPDGATSLGTVTNHPYLGVLERRDAATDAPANPLVLSLDPFTCRVTTFRK